MKTLPSILRQKRTHWQIGPNQTAPARASDRWVGVDSHGAVHDPASRASSSCPPHVVSRPGPSLHRGGRRRHLLAQERRRRPLHPVSMAPPPPAACRRAVGGSAWTLPQPKLGGDRTVTTPRPPPALSNRLANFGHFPPRATQTPPRDRLPPSERAAARQASHGGRQNRPER